MNINKAKQMYANGYTSTYIKEKTGCVIGRDYYNFDKDFSMSNLRRLYLLHKLRHSKNIANTIRKIHIRFNLGNDLFITDDKNADRIIKLAHESKTIDELSNKLGISSVVLLQYDIIKKAIGCDYTNEILNLHDRGIGAYKISRIVGVGHTHVLKTLIRYGRIDHNSDLTDSQKEEIAKYRDKKLSYIEIAKIMGISRLKVTKYSLYLANKDNLINTNTDF